ncbi:2-hydroxychromene-2-carboxylate isomerase [Motiliproteus sediminis]|uniref:2-hydroxychromene-2-carboxylate isomerase n=1 Tax=Motiliproteus sediminis TaxID=1468178 RepID=UPI001AEFE079|nr:2-hydroxychromene-2-carboxylate isomerase [Motiliproteus sediminis]
MNTVVDCYFTPISVWAYLGAERFNRLSQRLGVEARWKPVKIAEVFAASGALPLGQRPPSRLANRLQEIERWSEYLQIPLHLEPRFFPVDPTPACRLITAAILAGEDGGSLARACLTACWREQRDISNRETLAHLAAEAGLDGEALLARAAAAEVEAQLDAWTQEAIERGVIGSPCYLVDDQVFFGQDRLEFLERYLASRAG